MRICRFALAVWLVLLAWSAASMAAEPAKSAPVDPTPLPGTQQLDWTGDIASRLVDGVDKFLLGQLEKSVERRATSFKLDTSSPEKHTASLEPNRKRLAHILGVRDPRVPFDAPELVGTTKEPALVGRGHRFQVFAVRWPAFADVYGEGLLLVPSVNTPGGMVADPRLRIADVVAIPDAEQTPEQIAGLMPGVPAEAQFARRLAENGCRVLVPVLINRQISVRKLTNREYLYRSAFELGRHMIGYEVQKVLAGVDWFDKERQGANGQSTSSMDPIPVNESGKKPQWKNTKIGVIGYGEGGMLALYAGALDPRIDAVCTSGYFGPREGVWQEPIYRNVFGLLEQFGDAELAAMVCPRKLIIDPAKGPEVVVPPGTGGGPGRLTTPALDDVRREVARAKAIIGKVQPEAVVVAGAAEGEGRPAIALFHRELGTAARLQPAGSSPEPLRKDFQIAARHARQMHEIDRHSQWLLSESPYVRAEFMKKLDTSSPEKYLKTSAEYRKLFYDEVVGRFDLKSLPFNARSRKAYDQPKWTGYEVVLDVWPDVFAYGILLLPKDLKPGQRRPVVVCQHGLEGRPQDIVTGDHPAYHDFPAKLAERGFVTFAPQNLYLFQDRFRTLQRKANPIKKTLFSVIVPQHQQIVDWLKTQPFVDPERIGFYGLSYGGKSAMRIPSLVTDYALSICSADFNEWVWKNASTRSPYSYVWTGEYEIFEFDLGSTFNYSEMAALVCPRPFMVERGHFDGVSEDQAVAYEYAKVRHLYAAKLGIGDRTEIEFFVGPHTINGKGTYEFLHKHLKWPKPAGM